MVILLLVMFDVVLEFALLIIENRVVVFFVEGERFFRNVFLLVIKFWVFE